MADETGEKPWWESIKTSLTAPSTTEDQTKAMKLAALLQAQQGDNGLETTAYKGIHAMPSASAGLGNALQKGVAGYMAGMAGQKDDPMVTNGPLQHAVGPGGAAIDYVTPVFKSGNFLSNLFGG